MGEDSVKPLDFLINDVPTTDVRDPEKDTMIVQAVDGTVFTFKNYEGHKIADNSVLVLTEEGDTIVIKYNDITVIKSEANVKDYIEQKAQMLADAEAKAAAEEAAKSAANDSQKSTVTPLKAVETETTTH